MPNDKAIQALKRISQGRYPLDAIKRLTSVVNASKALKLTADEYAEAIDNPEPIDDAERAIYKRVYERVFADTNDATMAHQAAVGALRRYRLDMPVKTFKQGSDYLVKGWGILFGDRRHKDTDQEYFSTGTEFFLKYFGAGSPLWVEHGFDAKYGIDPVGSRVDAIQYDTGIYAVHRLDTGHRLFERTLTDCQAGKYGYSIDSVGHYASLGRQPDGALMAYPAIGWSLVAYPAEPGVGYVSVETPASVAE